MLFVKFMEDVFILARNNVFDVFNAFDLMENEFFLSVFNFGIGDGNLYYYFYNWWILEDLEFSEIVFVFMWFFASLIVILNATWCNLM